MAVTSATLYFIFKKKKLHVQTPPKSWKKIGTVEEILFFPVKSCAPIVLDSATCTNLGVSEQGFLDRGIMIVDRNNKFITGRTFNNLMQIKPRIISEGKLLLSAPGMEDMELDFNEKESEDIKVEIWNAKVWVKTISGHVDRWFSKFLLNEDVGLRLVYYPYDKATRPILKPAVFDNGIFLKSDTVKYFYIKIYKLLRYNLISGNPI